MAFEREVDVTKDSVGDYRVIFTVHVTGPDTGEIETQIVTSSDGIFTRTYNLIERLQDDPTGLVHLAALVALRDYLDIRLPDEILPIP